VAPSSLFFSILLPDKTTAFGRATLEGSADAARLDTLFPRESPVGQEEERMQDFASLAHVKWDCKYHVVFIPKCDGILGRCSENCRTQGKQDRGRLSHAGSRSHDDLDPAEIRGLAGGSATPVLDEVDDASILRQGTSLATNDLFPGDSAQDEPQPPLSGSMGKYLDLIAPAARAHDEV
jgi:hypothetical protein